MDNKVLISKKEGIAIYGQISSHTKRLTQFEVYAGRESKDIKGPYGLLSEAEGKRESIIRFRKAQELAKLNPKLKTKKQHARS